MVLDNLDSKQLEAVRETEGIIRVVAGAGSGKTRALTHRYAYIIDKGLAREDEILCITFTNKAAFEMRSRITKMLHRCIEGKYISTFHSLCVKILRENGHNIGIRENFTIMDADDKKTMLKRIIKDKDKSYSVSEVSDILSAFKSVAFYGNALREDYKIADVEHEVAQLIATVEDEMDITDDAAVMITEAFINQKISNTLEFDDLLNLVLYLFNQCPDVRAKWAKRFKYIMVDEFQDVSIREFELVDALKSGYGNLFVVGDPDQTIYTWRGADIRFMNDLDKLMNVRRTIIMDNNYRSDANIVRHSNMLIDHNKDRLKKCLTPMREDNNDVVFETEANASEQAAYIKRTIKDLHEDGTSYNDIAILYRQHSVSREIEEELMRGGIPYKVYKGTAFYNRKEVKDAIAYLRLLIANNDIDFLRIVNTPRRGFGPSKVEEVRRGSREQDTTMIEYMQEYCRFNSKYKKANELVYLLNLVRGKVGKQLISELLKEILTVSGYMDYLAESAEDDRINNVKSLIESIETYEKGLTNEEDRMDVSKYLEQIALVSDTDTTNDEGSVSLITMHGAKGMEFKVVFLASVCDGIIPNKRHVTESQIEEERRIAYVGMTRAMDRLYVLSYNGSTAWGDFVCTSRFVREAKGEI